MRFWFIIFGLIIPLVAQETPLRAFEGHVHDPGKWLLDERREELDAMLEKAEEQWSTRLFAVVLEENPPIGAEAYARKLGRDFGGDGVWGVVVHVPGEAGSPWCVAERGSMVKWATKESFDSAVTSAMNRARREPVERLRLQVACSELTDELGFLGVSAERMKKRMDDGRAKAMDRAAGNYTNRRWFRRVLMLGIPLLLLIVAGAAVIVRRRWKDRKKTFLFPETEHRNRFLGPWSGGGNVILRVTSKVGEDGSRRG
ncbi:MAG: hypothetical protein QNL77_02765 [Akkermansiaceae bacterium]